MRIKDFALDPARDHHGGDNARAGIPVAITTSSINTSCSIASADIWVYLRALGAGVLALLHDTDLTHEDVLFDTFP